MDQIKILIGHIEMEKYDLHLQNIKLIENNSNLMLEVAKLKNENINLRETLGRDLESK